MATPFVQRCCGAVVPKLTKAATTVLPKLKIRPKIGAESGIPFPLRGGASSRTGPVFKPYEMSTSHGRGKPLLERGQVAETTTKAPKVQWHKTPVHSTPKSRGAERTAGLVKSVRKGIAHPWSATRNPTHVLHGSYKSRSQVMLSRVPHRSYSSGGSSGSNPKSTGMLAAISGALLTVCAYFVGSREREEEAGDVDNQEEQLATVVESEDGDEDVIDVSTEDVTAPHDTLEEQESIQRIVSTLKPTQPKVTVIMGGGAMTQEILKTIYDRVQKTGSDESVVLFCSDPSRYAELMEIPGVRDRIQIRKLGYAMGNNPNFWKAVGEQLVDGGAQEIMGVNTRGGSAIPGRTSFREMNYAPIYALSTGLIAGVDSCAKLALAQLSTSMASHVERGFRGKDGQVDLYGATKLDGDTLLLAQKANGIIVRLNWGIHPTIPGNCPNHDYALPELVAFCVQPYFGRRDAITLQPVYARNVAAVLTDWRNIDRPMHVIDAVGTPMSMVDAMQVYADHMGRDLKLVKVPIKFMRWLATYAPRGHIQPYAIEYVDSQTNPDTDYTISPKGYDEALGNLGLRRLELAECLAKEEEVFVPDLPIREHGQQIAHVLWTNKDARREFYELLPSLSDTARRAIGVYMTGQSEVEEQGDM